MFPILGQPSAAIEPRDFPLDDSSLRYALVGSLDDFDIGISLSALLY